MVMPGKAFLGRVRPQGIEQRLRFRCRQTVDMSILPSPEVERLAMRIRVGHDQRMMRSRALGRIIDLLGTRS